MSRSDNVFPSYVKLDLDPKKPKDGWDDGARRCAHCGKAWPNVAVFSPSPCHNAVAGIVKQNAKPDMTWAEAVSALYHARFERKYEEWNEGLSDAELYWTNTQTPISDDEMNEGMLEIERLITEEHAR